MNQFGKDLSMNSLVSNSEYFKDAIAIFKGTTVISKFCQNSFFQLRISSNIKLFLSQIHFSIKDIIVIFL